MKKKSKSRKTKTAAKKIKRTKLKIKKGQITGPTSVAFLLDETGSMMTCKGATISGFNEYVQTLKNSKQKINFTLTKFNSEKSETVYDDVDIKDVKDLNDETYQPNNGTPLYDAIGKTVRLMCRHADTKKTNILVVIQTDGEENSSYEYTRDAICKLIQEKEKQGWTFVFLGANIDSYKVASSIGVKASNTANYSVANTDKVFRSMAMATTSYACSAKVGESYSGFYAKAGVDVNSFVDDEQLKAK